MIALVLFTKLYNLSKAILEFNFERSLERYVLCFAAMPDIHEIEDQD